MTRKVKLNEKKYLQQHCSYIHVLLCFYLQLFWRLYKLFFVGNSLAVWESQCSGNNFLTSYLLTISLMCTQFNAFWVQRHFLKFSVRSKSILKGPFKNLFDWEVCSCLSRDLGVIWRGMKYFYQRVGRAAIQTIIFYILVTIIVFFSYFCTDQCLNLVSEHISIKLVFKWKIFVGHFVILDHMLFPALSNLCMLLVYKQASKTVIFVVIRSAASWSIAVWAQCRKTEA